MGSRVFGRVCEAGGRAGWPGRTRANGVVIRTPDLIFLRGHCALGVSELVGMQLGTHGPGSTRPGLKRQNLTTRYCVYSTARSMGELDCAVFAPDDRRSSLARMGCNTLKSS